MLINHLKTALRNLRRNKGYSALSIFSLGTGMAVALLIGLWIFYQFSYDHFLPAHENAYAVKIRSTENGEVKVGAGTCLPLADAIKRDIPGIQHVAQTHWISDHLLSTQPHHITSAHQRVNTSTPHHVSIISRGLIASKDFLKIFQYPLIKGTAETVLHEPYSIVLSASTAKALFGEEDAIDKIVRFENVHDLKVSGILQDVPPNSSMQFAFIIPFSFSIAQDDWVKQNLTNWRNRSVQTFVSVDPAAPLPAMEASLKDLEKKYNPDDYKVSRPELFLHALRHWHLYGEFDNGVMAGGLIDTVKMFGIIGALVLAISCINFMNLTTARSGRRAKEVGIRKAIGSRRQGLILQFLTESIVVSFLALAVSLLVVQLSLPAFGALTQTAVTIPFDNITFWLIMAGYAMLMGILAGSRPAFYLSSFKAVKVLKGSVQVGRHASMFRRLLVVAQFTASIALINTTLIIYLQIRHA
ncbi:MAG TPA: ABC transporter permease, partial [Ohtaekwangia sp.]|nr:ABC transporter permease [Ohtaekwangia sp.]